MGKRSSIEGGIEDPEREGPRVILAAMLPAGVAAGYGGAGLVPLREGVSTALTYAALRKTGLGRWSPLFRALLLEDGLPVAEVSSLGRAEQIATLMNAAAVDELPPPVQTEASYSHYKATRDYAGKPIVLRAEWGGDVEQVARAEDPALVERIASLLERVDPAQKVRMRGTGIGWW